MGKLLQSTLAPNNGAESGSPPSEGLGLGGSSSLANSVATRLHGDSMNDQAKEEAGGVEGFTVSCAEDAVSGSESDSESEYDSEPDSDEEDLCKVGDGQWIDEEILAAFKEAKEMAIILYQNGVPGKVGHYWMAIAPEWTTALGFGATKEEACHNLEVNLVETKEWFIEFKLAHNIQKASLKPCKENADKLRHSQGEADYYDNLERRSTYWEWSTIRA